MHARRQHEPGDGGLSCAARGICGCHCTQASASARVPRIRAGVQEALSSFLQGMRARCGCVGLPRGFQVRGLSNGTTRTALVTYGRCLLAPAPQSLTTGFKQNEGYSYLSKDTPQLFGSLTQVGYLAHTCTHTQRIWCDSCNWLLGVIVCGVMCMCVCLCGAMCLRARRASVRSPDTRELDTRTGLHACRCACLLLRRNTKNISKEWMGNQ